MKKPLRQILILLAAFVTPAAAQTTFGSITGTVKDQSGAVAPGVQITVINQDTGVSRRAPTGSDGVYTVTDLLPGTYRLQAEQKGFNLLEQTGIVLDANRVVNVDVQLTVGSPSTKIEVSAQVALINTETPTTSFVKTADHLEDMPLLMRQSNSNLGFAVYNPGAGVNTSANIYANGVRQIDTYISNDGIVEMSDPTGVGEAPSPRTSTASHKSVSSSPTLPPNSKAR
jgi:Carboxypeptidase regulatory-like domain